MLWNFVATRLVLRAIDLRIRLLGLDAKPKKTTFDNSMVLVQPGVWTG